jgi:hypothetical protein
VGVAILMSDKRDFKGSKKRQGSYYIMNKESTEQERIQL